MRVDYNAFAKSIASPSKRSSEELDEKFVKRSVSQKKVDHKGESLYGSNSNSKASGPSFMRKIVNKLKNRDKNAKLDGDISDSSDKEKSQKALSAGKIPISPKSIPKNIPKSPNHGHILENIINQSDQVKKGEHVNFAETIPEAASIIEKKETTSENKKKKEKKNYYQIEITEINGIRLIICESCAKTCQHFDEVKEIRRKINFKLTFICECAVHNHQKFDLKVNIKKMWNNIMDDFKYKKTQTRTKTVKEDVNDDNQEKQNFINGDLENNPTNLKHYLFSIVILKRSNFI